MSFFTQAQKRHSAGRSHLSPIEVMLRVPWYNSRAWRVKKEAIARRVAKKNESAMLRRLEREDIKNGFTPEEAHARSEKRYSKLHPKGLRKLFSKS